jgi:hypothetical protein
VSRGGVPRRVSLSISCASGAGAEPRFLMVEPDDLRDPDTMQHDAGAFPEALPLENSALPLNYAYKPGQADDGVTLDVNVREAEDLTPAALDWAVPGHLEQKVEHYLRALPKELRRALCAADGDGEELAEQVAQRDRLTGRRESLTLNPWRRSCASGSGWRSIPRFGRTSRCRITCACACACWMR